MKTIKKLGLVALLSTSTAFAVPSTASTENSVVAAEETVAVTAEAPAKSSGSWKKPVAITAAVVVGLAALYAGTAGYNYYKGKKDVRELLNSPGVSSAIDYKLLSKLGELDATVLSSEEKARLAAYESDHVGDEAFQLALVQHPELAARLAGAGQRISAELAKRSDVRVGGSHNGIEASIAVAGLTGHLVDAAGAAKRGWFTSYYDAGVVSAAKQAASTRLDLAGRIARRILSKENLEDAKLMRKALVDARAAIAKEKAEADKKAVKKEEKKAKKESNEERITRETAERVREENALMQRAQQLFDEARREAEKEEARKEAAAGERSDANRRGHRRVDVAFDAEERA